MQSSPVGRQPLGGWQMLIPLGAYGRQDRLQHSPPHSGRVPPVVAEPQICPAGVQPVVPPATTTRPHRPRLAPEAFVQSPPQQSASAEQESPFCVQNEGAAEQMPFWQNFEQQSPEAEQGLPDVLQVALRGVQVPFVHLPPQHSPSVVQAALSAMHCFPEHLPETQETVQQSVLAVHASFGFLQASSD